MAKLPVHEIDKLVADAAEQTGVPYELLRGLVDAESGGDPTAVSPVGASGLTQLMPTTALELGVKRLHDPQENVMGGARYLRRMLDRFDDDPVLALAAYNAGAQNVIKHGGVPPFPETQKYVDRVMRRMEMSTPAPIKQPMAGATSKKFDLNDPKQRAQAFLTLGAPALNEAMQVGLVSPEEVSTVMGYQMPDGSPDADMISKAGLQLVRDLPARRELARDSQQRGQFSMAALTYLRRLGTGLLGGVGALGRTGAGQLSVMPAAAAVGGMSQELQREAVAEAHAKVEEKLGWPNRIEDPVRYEIAERNLPTTGRVAGEIGAYMTLARFLPAPTGSAVGGVLGRVAPMSAKALTLKTGGAAVGAYSASLLAPEDATAVDKAMLMAGGAGAGILLPSLLLGRPYGVLGRQLLAADRAGLATAPIGQGAGVAARFATLGRHAMYNPAATLGRIGGVGIQGAALGVTNAIAQGKTTEEAIAAGVTEGGLFMLGDALALRVGSIARWTDISTRFNALAATRLMELGMSQKGARAMSALTQGGIDVGAGAGIGAGAAGAMGGDPQAGAMVGALGGSMAFGGRILRDPLSRYSTLLPARVVQRIQQGGLNALHPDDAALVAGVVVKDAADTLAMESTDAAEALVLKLTAGGFVSADPIVTMGESGLQRGLRQLMAQDPLEMGAWENLPAYMQSLAQRENIATARAATEKIFAKTRLESAEMRQAREAMRRILAKGETRAIDPGVPVLASDDAAMEYARAFRDKIDDVSRVIFPDDRTVIARKAMHTEMGLKAGAIGPAEAREQLAVLEHELREAMKVHRAKRGISNRTFKQMAADEASETVTMLPPLGPIKPGEAGTVIPGTLRALAGGSAGVIGGSVAGGIVQEWARGPDERNPYAGKLLGALVGGGVGAALALKGGGFMLNRWGQHAANHAKFFKIADEDLLPVAEAVKLVGKKSTRSRAFMRMPTEQQLKHLGQRLTQETGAANKSIVDKQKAVKKLLGSFAPTGITTEAEFGQLWETIRAATLAAGGDEAGALRLMRGTLARAAIEPVRRMYSKDFNVLALARDSRFLPKGNTLEELRSIVLQADVATGPAAAMPAGARDMSRRMLGRSLHPEAEEFAEAMALADSLDEGLRGSAPFTETGAIFPGLSSRLSPAQSFRRAAKRLQDAGDATGDDVARFTEAMFAVTSNRRAEMQDQIAQLRRTFAGIGAKRIERVRAIMEGTPEFRAKVRAEDPQLYDTVTAFRKQIDDLAKRGGLPEGEFIESYFPWIYNAKTVQQLTREASKTGKGPSAVDMWIPTGGDIAEYKIAKNLLARVRGEPLGEIVENPVMAGEIYIRGVLNKIHYDPLLATFDNAFFRRLKEEGKQPHLARNLSRWFLDVLGVPSQKYLEYATRLRNIGVRVENFGHVFNQSSFLKRIMERYFVGAGEWMQSPDALRRMTSMARGWEFYSKIGLNPLSAMTNLTQWIVNSGTDFGFDSLLLGGPKFIAQAFAGKTADVLRRAMPKAGNHPFVAMLDTKLGGAKKYKLAQELGVFSPQSRQLLARYAKIEERDLGRGVGLTAKATAAGAFGGAVVGAMLPDTSAGQGAAVGAGAVGAGSLAAPKMIRWSLQVAKDRLGTFFDWAEIINRGMTAGAARRELAIAERVSQGSLSPVRARSREVVEGALTGAAVGAGVGAAFGEPGDRMAAAGEGAKWGALAGGALGLGGKPRFQRIAEETKFMRERGHMIPGIKDQLNAQGPPSREEVERWYLRQAIESTQFRLGFEGRPELLREPVGEVLGSLQTFTLNQMEFVGARSQSFYRSMLSGGQPDLRIFRHLMLIAGAGSAMQGLTLMADEDTSPYYWMSRIGMGMLPFMQWSDQRDEWSIVNVGESILGPFISDVTAATSAIFHLAVNDRAGVRWHHQLDDLSRQLIGAFRQVESMDTALGTSLDKLGVEGIDEMLMGLSQFGQAPVSTTVGQPGRGRGGSGGGLGGGGGGLGGGGQVGGGGGRGLGQ